MNKQLLTLSGTVLLGGILLSSYSGGPATSGVGNRTGLVASSAGCGGSGCHGGSSSSVNLFTVALLDGSSPVTDYVPGKQYSVGITANNTTGGHPKYGFQVACVKAGTTVSAGSFGAGSMTGIGTANAGGVTVMENKASLTGQTAGSVNAYTPLFTWTAPPSGTGPVKFYAVINSVDGNGSANSADVWDTASSNTYTVNTTGIGTVTAAGIRIFPNPVATDLQVLGLSAAGVLQIIDASGRILLEQSVAPGQKEATVPVATLPTGLYGLRVRTGFQIGGQLFLKQ